VAVRITWSPVSGFLAQTEVAGARPTSGRAKLEGWMRAAAAGEAAHRRMECMGVQPARGLIDKFRATLREIEANPGDEQVTDLPNLVHLGLSRDKEIRAAGVDAATGPEAWAAVWIEGEHQIHGELWPAVVAVAERLIETERDLDGQEVPALAAGAMTAHSQDDR
jgi:hypothetical protein